LWLPSTAKPVGQQRESRRKTRALPLIDDEIGRTNLLEQRIDDLGFRPLPARPSDLDKIVMKNRRKMPVVTSSRPLEKVEFCLLETGLKGHPSTVCAPRRTVEQC
jgi:hypothetical protein